LKPWKPSDEELQQNRRELARLQLHNRKLRHRNADLEAELAQVRKMLACYVKP